MEQIIQNHFVDPERSGKIRLALAVAYERWDNEKVTKAAKEAQDYVDEGGDFDNWKYDDGIEDYIGCAPDMMAEKYLVRLLHDRYMDGGDDDKEYIATGLTREMRIKHTIRCCGKDFSPKEWSAYCTEVYKDPSKRIITTIGNYDFNEHDICLNPTVQHISVSRGGYGYDVTLKWCDCGNGLWTYGLSCNVGSGGGGFGCSWADIKNEKDSSCYKAYHSEKECIIACCEEALRWIDSSGHKDEPKAKRLRIMVEDYKKSIGRPEPVQLSLFDF